MSSIYLARCNLLCGSGGGITTFPNSWQTGFHVILAKQNERAAPSSQYYLSVASKDPPLSAVRHYFKRLCAYLGLNKKLK